MLMVHHGRWWGVKTLACRLGRHEWTMRVEAGEEYRVCAVCGKASSGPPSSRGGQPPTYRISHGEGLGYGLEYRPHD
jgi:hypothetical protein